MATQVFRTPLHRSGVCQCKPLLLNPAVHFQRTDGGDDNGRLGLEAGKAALDVEELLGAEIGAEPGLGQHDVAEREAELRRDDGVAAVRDVAERTAVHQRGPALECLHQVRIDRVLEQQRHRTLSLQVAGAHGRLVAAQSNDDPREPHFEILESRRQRENRHDLRAGDDDETLFARRAATQPAQTHDDVAQRAVVHVDGARPRDAADVQTRRIAVVQMRVEHRGEQVVRAGDGVKIAGEMQVDVFHRHDLRVPAARGAALHAEHGTE